MLRQAVMLFARGTTPKAAARARLAVESLEGRTVPASFTAATVPELIAGIEAANLTPEPDTISLAAGTTFTLAAANNYTHGATGLPLIAAGEAPTILGGGSTVQRSPADGTPAFRLFDVAPGGSLTLTALILQGGLVRESSPTAKGGAVYSLGALTLNGVTVQHNTVAATWGLGHSGGVYSIDNLL
ncbi:MAG TPA: hypothetical protein VGF55_09620 [Gemmataceae bacterium]|jgi:plastocyanin